MLTSDNLRAIMRSHNQKHPNSCVASAFEFVAKLHELIPPESFPLQDDPKNQEQSFADSGFLDAQGLICQHNLYNTEETLEVLERETNEGRFPLIALLHNSKNQRGYHIYCVLLCNNQLMLVDPAVPRVMINNKEDLTKVIQQNSETNSERKTVDILLYDDIQGN